jgi:hypothetical protein
MAVGVDDKMTRMPFPPRWRHDVLRTLDYFRAADAASDPRLTDAIEVVRSKRQHDGCWVQQQPQTGKTWFTMWKPPVATA